MQELDDLNDLDDIEDEDFKEKKIKSSKNENEAPEESDIKAPKENEPNIFVTNNPEKSTSYKEKLLKIYADLEAITDEEIQEEINELKTQILELLNAKNESDEKLRKFASQEIDDKLKEEKDWHYLPKTKPRLLRLAKDTPLFTPTNILLCCTFIACVILSLILIVKL